MISKLLPKIGLASAGVLCSLTAMGASLSTLYQEMNVSPEEQAAIDRAMVLGRKISEIAETKNGFPYRRDAHAKATGCLRATFSINGDIPERYQHSIFAEPGKEYQAWIRYSNGDMEVQADKKPDARGMAVKVMGVGDDKIAPEFGGPATHDLIMTNTAAFFHRNIYDYVEDMEFLAKLQRTRWFVSFFPPRLHPKQLYRAVQTVSSKIDTPLQPQYFSMLPYQLGTTDIKFSAKPCSGMTFDQKPSMDDYDYLTIMMKDKLATEGACFDFMVQEKIPGVHMPLDDATVIWSEEKSPFIPVARINIPPQNFQSEEQNTFCENLSMNPWHAVGDWQPKGSLSRARRLVYAAVSEYRHKKNDAQVFQPDGWCLDGGENCDLTGVFNVTKPKWPLPRCFDPLYRPLYDEAVDSQCENDW